MEITDLIARGRVLSGDITADLSAAEGLLRETFVSGDSEADLGGEGRVSGAKQRHARSPMAFLSFILVFVLVR